MAAENINESEINGLGDSKPSEFSHHYAANQLREFLAK